MKPIQWNESYSVDVREIDAQHKKIVDCISQLLISIKDGVAKEAIGSILEQLVTYAETHFAYEEKLMELMKYPQIDEHKQNHRDFFYKVDSYKSKETVLATNIAVFLYEWLTEHISKEDKEFVSFGQENGFSF